MKKKDDGSERICPICGKGYTQYPACSRYDNKTDVCSDCGIVEAFNGNITMTARKLKLDFTAYAVVMNGAGYKNPLALAILEANKKAMVMMKNGKLGKIQ